jgi:hypothetical protein
MNFTDIFHIDNFLQKIKLDSSEKEHQFKPGEENCDEFKVEIENVFGNEWNQEYELIYLSYILEK